MELIGRLQLFVNVYINIKLIIRLPKYFIKILYKNTLLKYNNM
jgi:hypothetical protein